MKAAAPFDAAAQTPTSEPRLVEVASDVVEGARQVAADRAESADRGDRNEGRNQAVLDRGRTAVVLDELQNLRHVRSPSSTLQGRCPHRRPGWSPSVEAFLRGEGLKSS